MASDYSTTNYSSPFLSQVIIRMDFLEFIPSEILFEESRIVNIRQVFSQMTMRQIIRFNDVNVLFRGALSQTQSSSREGFQQSFSDQSGNKLTISNKYLILEINRYVSYEDAREKLNASLMAVIGDRAIHVSRTGIRYINLYESNRIKITKKMFNAEVSALVNPSLSDEKDGLCCIRSMCMNEYRFSDMRLNFRYGMFNPQYPNSMRDASFALDYDCYSDNLLNGLGSVLEHVDAGHDAIQRLFESTITDSLREKMRDE